MGPIPPEPDPTFSEPDPLPTEPELRAFVGRNADYYLGVWGPRLTGGGFNVAAFFLSGLWLGYRKMYTAVLILFGVILAETVLEEFLFVAVLRVREPPLAMTGLVGLAVGIVVGAGGNRWYLARARRAVERVRAEGLDGEAHLKALAERGGTSLGAALGLFLLFLAVSFALGFVTDLVVGATYTPTGAELAAEVKPLILDEWRKRPQLRGAVIQDVTLTHQGGKVYTGFVDATFGGRPERLALDVVYDRGDITWEVKPQAGR